MTGPAVVIPTLNPGPAIGALVQSLQAQTLAPNEILVIDSESNDRCVDWATAAGARVHPILRKHFNHGGTRNLGASLTSAPVVVFLTQDAIPQDEQFLENLCQPLIDGKAAAAFARQLPHYDAWPPEREVRAWNYPDTDEWRRMEDADKWGLRLVFFSNVASAVRRDRFEEAGCFPAQVIMNEDVVLAARLLDAGHTIAYLAAAQVRHSHNYSIAQQFRRSFDIGVFHARHHDLIPAVGTSGEGIRFVKRQCWSLLKKGHWDWLPRTVYEAAARFAAFHLGKREHLLGRSLKRRLAMHKGYFR
jgi:rhamnosyltransferase